MRVGGQVLAVTMRTPGNDVDLVHGFLLSEGVIATRDDVSVVRYCDGVDESGANTYNVLDIALAPGVPLPDHTTDRNTVVSSACGVCGKTSLDAVRTTTRHPLVGDTTSVTSTILSAMPVTLRRANGSSSAPVACTRPDCSPPPANSWHCARMSAVTTPSTR